MVVATVAALSALLLSGCASATPAPKTSAADTTRPPVTSSSSPTPRPTDAVELGVIASRDSPLATVDFLAQNHWSGYVGGTYLSVFAGIDRHHSDGRTPDAAVAVFRYPGAVEVGVFPSDTGATPLKVTSAAGDLLTLSDGHPHPIQFAVQTHRFSPASYPTSSGCSPNGQRMPAGVQQARIADIDHDGRPDTEWARLIPGTGDVRFGITTASGATFTADASFAGGAARSFVSGTLANGVTVLMPSEGRATDLWTVAACALHQAHSTVPTYSGDFGISSTNNQTGAGSATCIDGRLAAIALTPDGSATDTVADRYVDVSGDGTTATLTDRTTVVARHVDLGTTANTRRYTGISCGTSRVLALN